ncbi:TetR/AcrR family transcriptional regulator [Clostridium estertheticum]|uniref:TetR/AcrR family transcriptional regulator n=1 Tax=Clostridium estertheticum TaxID=238834 RepID=UPI001C6DE7AE|nr:TetR/AcrR family transcriptional regulator [Clostridium estertheticum]MBW9169930.1 TetR/AcrR family transcriptional regulator [Clostridium estertheticum]WLC74581.1 TetR/AcrR family transcriptional regulator [Clostridium estertheticum]
MRISKDPKERKDELMDAAEELFSKVGYNGISVSDIVKKVSVSQGTFYYYFKSKEDMFIDIFARNSEVLINKLQEETKDNNINALQKLIRVVEIYAQSKENKEGNKLVEALHYDENTSLHHKVIVQGITSKLPVFTDIIIQGVDEGIFHTEYPREVAEFMLTEFGFVLDPGVFGFNKEQIIKKSEALTDMIEKILGLTKGSFVITL